LRTLRGPVGLTYKNCRCCKPNRPAGGKTFLEGLQDADTGWLGSQAPGGCDEDPDWGNANTEPRRLGANSVYRDLFPPAP